MLLVAFGQLFVSWHIHGIIFKHLTHLGVGKDTTVVVASILAKIKQSETVVGITNGKEHNAEKAFIVMEEGASEFWACDSYMFPIDASNKVRHIPEFFKLLCNL